MRKLIIGLSFGVSGIAIISYLSSFGIALGVLLIVCGILIFAFFDE
jgi:hypothetical protein